MTGGFVYLPDFIPATYLDMILNTIGVKEIEYPGAFEWLGGVYNSGKTVIFHLKIEEVIQPIFALTSVSLDPINGEVVNFSIDATLAGFNASIYGRKDNPNKLFFRVIEAP